MVDLPAKRRAIDVQHYSDLTRSDIALLVKVWNFRTIGHKQHEQATRLLIENLPIHLRSKIPWLTTSCSTHNKINPLPIKSLLQELKKIVEVDLPLLSNCIRFQDAHGGMKTVALLENCSALWLPTEVFEQRYKRSTPSDSPFAYQETRCACCVLTSMSHSVDALIALGGCFIGRVNTRKWKQSKRIIWLEEWVRSLVDDEQRENAIQEMWELGGTLRKSRKTLNTCDPDRPYVEEYIREAKAAEKSYRRRPPRSPAQRDHVAFVRRVLLPRSSDDTTMAPIAGTDRPPSQSFDLLERVDPKIRQNSSMHARSVLVPDEATMGNQPVSQLSSRFSSFSSHRDTDTDSEEVGLSRRSGNGSWTFSPSVVDGGIIGLAESVEHIAPHAQLHDPDASDPDPHRARDNGRSMTAKPQRYPATKLQPVVIPPSRHYELDEHMERELQKRKDATRKPVLRMGKNGHVKGPFDAVSQASLVSRATNLG